MNWETFTLRDETYDLTHLHSCMMQFQRPEKDEKPATTFNVDVSYGLHCFTRKAPQAEQHDKRLEYSDARETRLFDLKRYEYSKLLPHIVKSLADRRCRQTGFSNYLTIECRAENRKTVEYDVFFTVSKSSRKGRLNLFIQSAYVRDDPKSRPPSPRPIRFLIILHNTLNNKFIRA